MDKWAQPLLCTHQEPLADSPTAFPHWNKRDSAQFKIPAVGRRELVATASAALGNITTTALNGPFHRLKCFGFI